MSALRPHSLPGITYEMTCACGRIYVTANDLDGRLFEVFLRLGKSGGCAAAVNEGAARLASKALRSGVPVSEVADSLSGIRCHISTPTLPSCLAAVSAAIRHHIEGDSP